jgi:hypothetical protein
MGLQPTQGDEKRLLSKTTLHGCFALPLVIPSSSTCLRQVEGEMTQLPTPRKCVAHSSLPFFWLEWGSSQTLRWCH